MEINPRLFDKHGRLRLGRGGISCTRWHPLYPAQPYMAVGLSSGEIIILRVEHKPDERRIAIEEVQEFPPVPGFSPQDLDWGPQRGDDAGRYLAVAYGEGGTVRVLDVEENHEYARFVIGGHVSNVVFSPDGQMLAVNGAFSELRLLRISDGITIYEQLSGLLELDTYKGRLAFHPDGGHLAVSNPFGILDVFTGQWSPLETHKQAQRCHHISYSPDGRYLLTGEAGEREGNLVLRSARTGLVEHLAFDGNTVSGTLWGKSVWGAESDRVLFQQQNNNEGARHDFWVVKDIHNGNVQVAIKGENGSLDRPEPSLSPNGAVMGLAGARRLSLHDIADTNITGHWECGTRERNTCFSPCMSWMFAYDGVNEGKECIRRSLPNMRLTDVRFNSFPVSFNHHPVFASDASSVVLCSDQGHMAIYEDRTERVSTLPDGHATPAVCWAVSPDSRYLVSISKLSNRAALLFHNLTTGAVVPGFASVTNCYGNPLGWWVAIAPDGRNILLSSDNQTDVMQASGRNWQPFATWQRDVHAEGYLRSSVFSPDGAIYVENRFFNDAESLCVYDAISGRIETTCGLGCFTSLLRHFVFSPCGRWIVGFGNGSSRGLCGIGLISSADWRPRLAFDERYQGDYDHVAFSSDGRYLALSGVSTMILDLDRALGSAWFAEYQLAPLIVTAVWFPKGSLDYLRESDQGTIVTDRPLARCGACNRFFPVEDTMLGTELRCPNEIDGRRCNRLLKLNPFIAGFQDPEVC